MQAVESLLLSIKDTNNKYREISKATGENFNIFKILKIQSNEVLTHTPFLAELLNSKGSHNCGDSFLKLFLNLQKEKYKKESSIVFDIDKFNTLESSITVEKYLGFKNEEETEGGRIDVLLKDQTGNAIIIENKIFAKDQFKQLVRYKNAYPYATLFYLTLEGGPPCTTSTDKLIENVDYYCISYKHDIVFWLSGCIKEASLYPIVRETINQYLYLIKSLTGQNINNTIMTEIVEKIIASKENLEAAFAINACQDQIKTSLFNKLKSQLHTMAFAAGFKPVDDEFGDKDESYFHFYMPNTKHAVSICFGFDKKYKDFSIGVVMDNYSAKLEIYEALRPLITQQVERSGLGKSKNFPNWAFLYYPKDDLCDWTYNKDLWSGILTMETAKRLMKIVNQVYESIKDMEL